MWRQNYIAVDWGTTNRRAWLIGAHGKVAGEFSDNLGLLSVPPAGFDSAVAEIRSKLGAYPMLLAGMVGSDKGWRKAPYLNCPADAQMLAGAIVWVEPLHTGIVPGVCQIEGRPDVMRGEETQAVGAVAEAWISADAYICHPGTHTKWITLKQGRIDSFQTTMAGEIFNLLKTSSILSAQMGAAVTVGSAFEAGLDEIRAGVPLLAALFAVRARYLLQHGEAAGASFASGLLIGSDVQAGLAQADAGEKVAIIGQSDLCQLYETAIGHAGFKSEVVDGSRAFLAGIRAIIRCLPTGSQH